MNLATRSSEPELMDLEAASLEDTRRVLHELGAVNQRLGGTRSSMAAMLPAIKARGGPITLLDVGAGGGDLPAALARWARTRDRALFACCLDLSHTTCRAAAERAGGELGPGARRDLAFVAGDAFRLPLADRSVDLVHCSMMTHHFSEAEIVLLLAEMRRVARVGILVNDLQRHPLAYHGIRILTGLLSRSRFVRHDAPLSVARGFRRRELERIWRRAGLEPSVIRWSWAFRYLVWTPLDGAGRR